MAEHNIKFKQNRGSVLVEASIYFPLVICTVMALLYLGLIHMQESSMNYVAERIALEVSREEAYAGYHIFNMNEGTAVDFSWNGSMPFQGDVKTYYQARHKNLGVLYREFGQIASLLGFNPSDTTAYESKYADTAKKVAIIAAGSISNPQISIKRGVLSSSVTVSIQHKFPVPGVLKYLGVPENSYTITTTAIKNMENPTEFVRNVDLTADLIKYLLEKLGLSESVNNFLEKTKNIMEKIL